MLYSILSPESEEKHSIPKTLSRVEINTSNIKHSLSKCGFQLDADARCEIVNGRTVGKTKYPGWIGFYLRCLDKIIYSEDYWLCECECGVTWTEDLGAFWSFSQDVISKDVCLHVCARG